MDTSDLVVMPKSSVLDLLHSLRVLTDIIKEKDLSDEDLGKLAYVSKMTKNAMDLFAEYNGNKNKKP